MSRLKVLQVDPYFGFVLDSNYTTKSKFVDADLIFYAAIHAKGYTCLTKYNGSKVPITVRCPEHHEIEGFSRKLAIPCHNCSICWEDDGISSAEKVQIIVTSRNGVVLSAYDKSHRKMSFRCHQGHQFDMPPDYIISGRWCTLCASNNVAAARDKFYQVLRERGGVALTEYVNSTSYVTIRCHNGHTFDQVPSSTNLGYWCHTCSGSTPLPLVKPGVAR